MPKKTNSLRVSPYGTLIIGERGVTRAPYIKGVLADGTKVEILIGRTENSTLDRQKAMETAQKQYEKYKGKILQITIY